MRNIVNIGLKSIRNLLGAYTFRLNRALHERVIFKYAPKEFIFSSIWRSNYWGSAESHSGPGSTMDQTRKLVEELPKLFSDLNVKTILDAPCGDLNWMQHILNGSEYDYIGGDIVGKLVRNNEKRYGTRRITFRKLDITKHDFPAADLWLCRHTLFHFSYSDIYLALKQFVDSDIEYFLTTNCITTSDFSNSDILTGGWRRLNLFLPPFNFPRNPLWQMDDFVYPTPPTTLTLWTKEQIVSSLPHLIKFVK